MQLKMETAMSPGLASGNAIIQKVRHGEAPSISAASSISVGRVLKKPVRTKIEKGSPVAM